MNDTQTFQLKNLGIERIEELPGGLPEFEEFSGKLNIISGPNGSGKSSTARSIQHIIWNSETKKPVNISARAKFGEHDWLFKSRDGIVKQYIDQTESDLKNLLPATEAKDRYLLSLHDLIKSDDEDLARLMVRESNGGYDVAEAKNQLGYSDSIRNKSLSEYKRVQESKKKVEEIKKDQRARKKDEQELDNLYQRKREIKDAELEAEVLRRIRDFRESEHVLKRLKGKKEVFPAQLQKLREGDYEQIQNLEKNSEQLKQNLSSAVQELEHIQSDIQRLNLPEGGISEQLVFELEEYVQKLKDTEQRSNKLTVELKRTEEKLIQIKESLQESGSIQSTDIRIDDSDIEEFEKLQLKASELRSETVSLNQLASLYERSVSEKNSSDTDHLEQAIELLSIWPGLADSGASISGQKLILIAGLILVSATLSWFQPIWGIAVLAATLILLITFWITGLKEQKKQRETIRSKFNSLEFEAPEEWSPDEIKRIRHNLIKKFQSAKRDDILLNDLKRVKSELTQTLQKWTGVEKKMDKFLSETGITPKFEPEDEKHYQSLYWFLKQLSQLINEQINIRSLKASAEETDRQFQVFRAQANDILRTAGFEEGENATQISGKYRTLNSRVNRWRELKQEEKSLTEKRARLRENLHQTNEKISNLYQRLGVDSGDTNAVYELDKQKESYDKLVSEIAFAEKESEMKKQELHSSKAYQSDAESLTFTSDQIDSELERVERVIAEKEQVVKRITEIETIVQQLKSQQNLEQAIAELESSKEELRGRYEENLRSIAGDTITRELASELQFNNQSEMFNRAAKLFATITAGRYQLQTGTGTDSGFYTWDSVLDEPKSLDQLSTGTRVQLLLSVRLAFIESQEKSLKLPLLADELLANSDDERASKIIDALQKIAEEGRQVFYFTAQDDEVAKWKQALEQGENPTQTNFYRLSIDGKHHNSQKIDPVKIPTISVLKDTAVRPPEPDESYLKYVENLNLPKFNPLKETVSELHVWFLLDDASTLCQLLNTGIHKYGSFRYLDEMETLPGEIDTELAEKITKNATFIEKYCELIRKGKDRFINRTQLLESEQVSDKFIDEASELLEEVNHKPAEFMKALWDGDLKRFHSENKKNLQEWLINNEFISEEKELSEDELRLRIQSAAMQVGISLEQADELLDRLTDW